jgi:hypothetical protein
MVDRIDGIGISVIILMLVGGYVVSIDIVDGTASYRHGLDDGYTQHNRSINTELHHVAATFGTQTRFPCRHDRMEYEYARGYNDGYTNWKNDEYPTTAKVET